VYGSIDTLTTQFGVEELDQLAPGASAGQPDGDRLTAALVRASREADSWLASRYVVPVVSADGSDPQPLTAYVGDMARYHLTGGDAQEAGPINRRYQEALTWLKAVASGTVDVPGATENGVSGDDGDDDALVASGDIAFYPGKRVWSF
jgi:phage gp36-like protein